MQQYKCLIVEDEPLAAEVLQDYIAQVPFLTLAGTCEDAIYAMDFLGKEDVDLVFLDIHLPKLKGLDFLKTLKNPPAVIVTTAYHEYALQGYEYNITDYLLKPVEFTRFLTAVNKIRNSGTRSGNPAALPAGRKSYFFNANKKKVKIFFDEILYVESLREYIRIVTKSKSIITKLPLGQIEELLSDGPFLRVHRSFIVSVNKIDVFSTTDVEINGKQIPVGRHFKESLLLAMGSTDC